MTKVHVGKVEEHFICSCQSIDHQFLFSYEYEPATDKYPEYKVGYIQIHLSKHKLHKRIWYALKYVFGFQCKYGAFDEFILTSEDAEKLSNGLSHLIEK